MVVAGSSITAAISPDGRQTVLADFLGRRNQTEVYLKHALQGYHASN